MLTCPLPDVKLKVEAATQLRDNLEHYITGPIYPAFLKKLIPIFINCLKGPPVFISTSLEQVRASSILPSPVLIYYRNYEAVFSKSSTDYLLTLPNHSNHMQKKWWIF
jgi:hypothetical protein